MLRGNARRRAAGAQAWAPPRLRTCAMNLLGRAPNAHAALGLWWRTAAGASRRACRVLRREARGWYRHRVLRRDGAPACAWCEPGRGAALLPPCGWRVAMALVGKQIDQL